MEKELKILMLEDLEEDAGLLDRVLTKERISFTRLRVDSKQEYIEALTTYAPDLILSDHALPQFNSIEALKIAQERKIDAPFIIVTGTVSEEFAVNCLKKGADDYVLKSNLSRLPSAIVHALSEHNNVKVRKEQELMLFKKNEELNKINKELDSFVYSISHNLRSPLASILGIVNLARLEREKDWGTADRYFSLIGKSTLKLDETLKEILDYSQNLRTEIGRSELDLVNMIEEGFRRLEYLPGASGIKRQINLKDAIPFYSDRYRLSVIITSLISNSIKFRDEHKSDRLIDIDIIVSPSQVELIIFDNGVGIHPDYLPDVTNMFFRANENSEGAGLGLYIVKEVVERLGGIINIESEYGQWTLVKLSLPNLKDD